MAISKIVDIDNESDQALSASDTDSRLLSWCLSRVQEGERYRDQNYEKKWNEYYRLWRGIWDTNDKSRQSERSKLIAPALQSAVESIVAEQEEAIFGRKQWFDLVDNYEDRLAGEDKDLQVLRMFLMDRFEQAKVPSAMSEMFLNAAIYGTAVGKVITETVNNKEIVQNVDEQGALQIAQLVETQQIAPEQAQQLQQQITTTEVVDVDRFLVKIESISPFDFVIDPAARTIEEAEYCAHVTYKPLHDIVDKQVSGIYRQADVSEVKANDRTSGEEQDDSEGVKIFEYFGLVPESLIDVDLKEGEELVELNFGDQSSDRENGESSPFDVIGENLVEAIVTVANDSQILRAIRNPFWNEDRPLVAFQHDTVPNSFWGRGVCEKGYNSQKALDAELRARMDGLALTVHPMMGIDATRMPRSSSFTVSPGKTIPTNGNPREILSPFNFGQVDPAIFQSTGDLERMVQVATGTSDPSSPLNVAPTNSTASGMSMALSTAIKRSRRILSNIERSLIKPFLKKAAWRFMQFDEENFPVRDINFVTKSTLGITARELEQQQLIGLLQTVPPESPAFMVMLKAIYDNSSLSNKEELVTVIEQMMQPDPQAQQIQQLETELAFAKEQSEIAERQSRISRNEADSLKTLSDIELGQDKLDTELQKEILDLLAARANKQNGSEMNGATEPGNGEVLPGSIQPNGQTGMGNV